MTGDAPAGADCAGGGTDGRESDGTGSRGHTLGGVERQTLDDRRQEAAGERRALAEVAGIEICRVRRRGATKRGTERGIEGGERIWEVTTMSYSVITGKLPGGFLGLFFLGGPSGGASPGDRRTLD